jgi:hypothetical protein
MNGSPSDAIAAKASHSASVRDTRGTSPADGALIENLPPSSEKPPPVIAPPVRSVTAGPFSPWPGADPARFSGTWHCFTALTAVACPAVAWTAGVAWWSPPAGCTVAPQPASSATAVVVAVAAATRGRESSQWSHVSITLRVDGGFRHKRARPNRACATSASG